MDRIPVQPPYHGHRSRMRLRAADLHLRLGTLQHPALQSLLYPTGTLLVERARLCAERIDAFAGLCFLLQAGEWRTRFSAADNTALSAALMATLAMTTLLPSIPVLKRVDEWLLAAISRLGRNSRRGQAPNSVNDAAQLPSNREGCRRAA